MATLFPIGTIVKLNDGDQNMMVAGYGGANAQGQVFDYIGLPCPVGIIDKNMTVLFNDAQIETLRYMGYIDAPTQTYIAKVEEAGREHLPVFKDAGRGVDVGASPSEVAGVSSNASDGAGVGADDKNPSANEDKESTTSEK